jgi:hypothetical protein
MTEITEAVRRAFKAVADGEVVRIYRTHGSILRGPKGIGANTLWRLARNRWIEDAKEGSGGLEKVHKQALTKSGQAVLKGQ